MDSTDWFFFAANLFGVLICVPGIIEGKRGSCIAAGFCLAIALTILFGSI
jgi:hypothetical protein